MPVEYDLFINPNTSPIYSKFYLLQDGCMCIDRRHRGPDLESGNGLQLLLGPFRQVVLVMGLSLQIAGASVGWYFPVSIKQVAFCVGVRMIRALLFGVHVKAPVF